MFFFHLPPSTRWNPLALCTDLVTCGIEAAVVRSEIHLTFSSEYCEAWRMRYSRQIARRERTLRGVSRPHASVRYFPDRFLRNLELRREPFKVPLLEPQLNAAVQCIHEFGAIYLDSIETEFRVASQHCSDHGALTNLRQQLEELLKQKERHVEEQEFQAAADTHHLEYEVRAKLDTLLFHGE